MDPDVLVTWTVSARGPSILVRVDGEVVLDGLTAGRLAPAHVERLASRRPEGLFEHMGTRAGVGPLEGRLWWGRESIGRALPMGGRTGRDDRAPSAQRAQPGHRR